MHSSVRWPQIAVALFAAALLQAAHPSQRLAAQESSGVSFADGVAPVLVENCLGCHGAGRASAGLSMASFEKLLEGGQSGSVIEPGQPADSLLVQKINGTAVDGQRMPLRRAALAPEVIERISAWVAAGAKFDGRDPKQPLAKLVNARLAASLSAAELSDRRAASALERLRLALPDQTPQTAESSLLRLVGNASSETLEEFADAAEALWPKLARQIGADPKRGPVAGQAALLVFTRGVDLGEFVQMVHKQQPRRGQTAVWRCDEVEAYAAVALGETADAVTLRLRAAEALAGIYLSATAPAPHWLAAGVARAAAARLEPKAADARAWEAEAARALAEPPKAAAVLAEQLSLSDADAVGYAVGKSLLRNPKQLRELWRRLADEQPLDEALQGATGQPLTAWLVQAQAGSRGKKGR